MKACCSIDGCGRVAFSRTWCKFHYQRWWRHGDPLHGPTPVIEIGVVGRNDGGNPELTAVLQGRSIEDLAAFCDWILLELGGATVPPAHAEAWFNTLP